MIFWVQKKGVTLLILHTFWGHLISTLLGCSPNFFSIALFWYIDPPKFLVKLWMRKKMALTDSLLLHCILMHFHLPFLLGIQEAHLLIFQLPFVPETQPYDISPCLGNHGSFLRHANTLLFHIHFGSTPQGIPSLSNGQDKAQGSWQKGHISTSVALRKTSKALRVIAPSQVCNRWPIRLKQISFQLRTSELFTSLLF